MGRMPWIKNRNRSTSGADAFSFMRLLYIAPVLRRRWWGGDAACIKLASPPPPLPPDEPLGGRPECKPDALPPQGVAPSNPSSSSSCTACSGLFFRRPPPPGIQRQGVYHVRVRITYHVRVRITYHVRVHISQHMYQQLWQSNERRLRRTIRDRW